MKQGIAMNLTINGQARQIDGPLTVTGLLNILQLDENRVAVEHNREVLLKADFAAVKLSDNDRLEIVQFVGGG